MKKVIRLTESELINFVKKTITELDRTTYEKAAKMADKKGYTKLADRFTSHGKDFGLNQDRETISMVVKRQGEKTHRVRIVNLESPRGGYHQNEFVMTTEDVDTGEKKEFNLNKLSNNIEFYLKGDYPALPETRKDARKVLKQFENVGVDVSEIDPRKISYEHSDF